MKVYLDDMRPAPNDYQLARTYGDAIKLLKTGKVTHISFDHDLGTNKTGYDVLTWIEERVFNKIIKAPKITIHTANPSAREKMLKGVRSIYRMSKK